MAIEVETTPKSVSVSMKLNNGVDTEGEVKTVGVSIGSLNITNYDAGKAYEVANAISQCLSKTLYKVEQTMVSQLTPKE